MVGLCLSSGFRNFHDLWRLVHNVFLSCLSEACLLIIESFTVLFPSESLIVDVPRTLGGELMKFSSWKNVSICDDPEAVVLTRLCGLTNVWKVCSRCPLQVV